VHCQARLSRCSPASRACQKPVPRAADPLAAASAKSPPLPAKRMTTARGILASLARASSRVHSSVACRGVSPCRPRRRARTRAQSLLGGSISSPSRVPAAPATATTQPLSWVSDTSTRRPPANRTRGEPSRRWPTAIFLVEQPSRRAAASRNTMRPSNLSCRRTCLRDCIRTCRRLRRSPGR